MDTATTLRDGAMSSRNSLRTRPQGDRAVVVGAGIAGLAAAIRLAARGIEVVVVESADRPGGKIRVVEVGGATVDSGPTVLTMRWVFDELFGLAGGDTASHVALKPAEILARHAWGAGERLDLFADTERTARAIEAFADAAEADRYRAFCERSAKVYRLLEDPFIRSARPTAVGLATSNGVRRMAEFAAIEPFTTLWRSLSAQFRDPRLRQLFGRYATYCGSSPFQAPATLMLVAHVEQTGVWIVEGGMAALPDALAAAARKLGATLRFGVPVEAITVDGGRASAVRLAGGETIGCGAVIFTGDVSALGAGLLGPDASGAAPATPRARRSLSALTVSMLAKVRDFPLVRHNVFFGPDPRAEFEDIFRRRGLPRQPTVYLCAQDRGGSAMQLWPDGRERLFAIVNAPADGDIRAFEDRETAPCLDRAFALLDRCGLSLSCEPTDMVVTTPADFARRYPATGGALYGPAAHGWRASFQRNGATSRVPRLYLAGGSVHPGPGVPMAALSGRLAAERVLQDLTSPDRFRRAAMPGGISMR